MCRSAVCCQQLKGCLVSWAAGVEGGLGSLAAPGAGLRPWRPVGAIGGSGLEGLLLGETLGWLGCGCMSRSQLGAGLN